MAKSRTKWSKQAYLKRLKEGRGKGSGKDYRPWITIHDFASRGTVSRIPGNKTGRIHHLMSHLERDYFYLLDEDPEVTDIREQFPLDLNETIDIACDCQIRHPWDSSAEFPVVMTTDFLINKGSLLLARAVKPSSDLSNRRILEKLEIERRYWTKRSVDWKIVTEKEINQTRCKNIIWLRSGAGPAQLIPDQSTRDDCTDYFLTLYNMNEFSIYEIIQGIEEYADLKPGTAISILKFLIQTGQIPVDLNRRIDLGTQSGIYSEMG